MVTQIEPVAAAGDVVGVAGQVRAQEVAGAGALAGQPVPDDGAGRRTRRRRRTTRRPLARPRWRRRGRRGRRRSCRPGRRRSSRPGPGVLRRSRAFHSSMPNFVDESENHIVPSEATAALLQNTIAYAVHAVDDRLDRPGAECRRGAARGARRRPAAARRDRSRCPSGRPPVSATRSTSAPSGLTRQIAPSSVPVKTAPSSGPWVATTTSSAPGPGTGTTVMLCSDCWAWSPGHAGVERRVEEPRDHDRGGRRQVQRAGGRRLHEHDLPAFAADDVRVGEIRRCAA